MCTSLRLEKATFGSISRSVSSWKLLSKKPSAMIAWKLWRIVIARQVHVTKCADANKAGNRFCCSKETPSF